MRLFIFISISFKYYFFLSPLHQIFFFFLPQLPNSPLHNINKPRPSPPLTNHKPMTTIVGPDHKPTNQQIHSPMATIIELNLKFTQPPQTTNQATNSHPQQPSATNSHKSTKNQTQNHRSHRDRLGLVKAHWFRLFRPRSDLASSWL